MPAKTPRQLQIEALLADDPDDPFLRYGYAMEFVGAGNDAAAVSSLRELVAKTPYVPAFLQLGQALVRLDRIAEAQAALKQGVEAARAQGDAHAQGGVQGLVDSFE